MWQVDAHSNLSLPIVLFCRPSNYKLSVADLFHLLLLRPGMHCRKMSPQSTHSGTNWKLFRSSDPYVVVTLADRAIVFDYFGEPWKAVSFNGRVSQAVTKPRWLACSVRLIFFQIYLCFKFSIFLCTVIIVDYRYCHCQSSDLQWGPKWHCISLFITPYRQHKNTYYTHTMNAICTITTKNTKKETWH